MISHVSKEWEHLGLDAVCPTRESWLQDIHIRCRCDTSEFEKFFIPDSFDGPDIWQRQEHIRLIDDDTIPMLWFCCFRSFGKTTRSWSKMVKNACYRLEPFTVVSSRTLDYATTLTENVKSEVLTNPSIREAFGNLKPVTYEGLSVAFSAKTFFLSDPKTGQPFAVYVPKGQGQQCNGLLIQLMNRMVRPTFHVIEDGEDRDEVQNEDLRAKYLEWVFGALLPTVSTARPDPHSNRWLIPKEHAQWRPPWRVLYQDTLKHPAAAIETIRQAGDWVGKTYPMCERRKDKEFYSLVPDLVSDDQVRAQAKAAEQKGMLRRFAMEYMCRASSEDSDQWTPDLFQHYQERGAGLSADSGALRFITVDPARTSGNRAAYSSIMAVAAKPGKIWIRKNIHDRLTMEEIPTRAYMLAIDTNTRTVAVEVTGGEDQTRFLFETILSSMGLQREIELVWLDARECPKGDFGSGRDSPKRARASMLLPFYRRMEVWHEEGMKDGPLENQLLSYPHPGHWDATDTASYIPVMLRRAGMYWDATQKDKPETSFGDGRGKNTLRDRIRSGCWRISS
jgi:hypothetical protein